jgi:hypothetical protein
MHDWLYTTEGNDKSLYDIWMSTNYHAHITSQKRKGKWEYCPVLNAGPENYKNMAVFKAGSWYCGTNVARPGAEYRHILPMNIFAICIRVYYNETFPSSPSWNLTEKLSRTLCTNLVLFPEIAQVQSGFSCVVRVHQTEAVWRRKHVKWFYSLLSFPLKNRCVQGWQKRDSGLLEMPFSGTSTA